MNKQNRNRIVDTENILMVARWEGRWEMGKKGEGIKMYQLFVTELSWGCEVQHRNTVSNNLITMNGVRWERDLLDDHLLSYTMSNHWGIHLHLITMYVNCN